MNPRTGRIAGMVLAAALATHVAAQDEDGPEPGDAEESGATRTVEPCDLDGEGGGQVVRVAGAQNGANMSVGFEDVTFELESRSVFAYRQWAPRMRERGDSEPDPWRVQCAPGTVELDGVVRLSVRGGSARPDPTWLRALAPGARGPGIEELQRIREILGALVDVDVGEAKLRASLLLAERAVAAGETDVASGALEEVDPRAFPPLAEWAKKVQGRLAEVRGTAPVRATKPRRLGALAAVPSRPDDLSTDGERGSEPGLFWRGSAVCVRQEGAERAKMRCHDAVRGRWGPLEPYASPFAGGVTIVAENLGPPRVYATLITVVGAGNEKLADGEFHRPELLARDATGGLVVLGAGVLPGDPPSVTMLGYDAAASAGSRLAGGGAFWFDDAGTIRALKKPGQSWNAPTPSADPAVRCEGPPLTSPDEKRAVCLVAKLTGHELWLFELAPR